MKTKQPQKFFFLYYLDIRVSWFFFRSENINPNFAPGLEGETGVKSFIFALGCIIDVRRCEACVGFTLAGKEKEMLLVYIFNFYKQMIEIDQGVHVQTCVLYKVMHIIIICIYRL